MIFKKALSRRCVLRGIGTTLALPLLDAMVPALTAAAQTPAKAVRRFHGVYIPNGAALDIRLPNGTVIDHWTPDTDGRDFAFTPILKPLEPFRDHVTILTGLGSRPSDSAGEGNGDHARACSTWLGGIHVKRAEVNVQAGATIDQMAADVVGEKTSLRSLELAVDDFRLLGACDNGYACTYFNTLSWRTPTTPVPCQVDPRIVFERLFGDGGGAAARQRQLRQDRSILDSVAEEIADLRKSLGAADRAKVTQYLDGVREVEGRIARFERTTELAVPDLPVYGIPEAFDEHVKLMFDLQVLAFQGDLTRIGTFLLSREASFRAYPWIGVPEAHHPLSHHGNSLQEIEKMAKINTYHASLLGYYLEKLRATADGDGSLLDHITILYGGGMSDGNLHTHVPLPAVVIGGGSGSLKGNRHLRYDRGTPMANLLLSLLDLAGGPELERIGDSTGRLAGFV